MDKTKESLSIRLLDSHSNPLKNQEFRLFEVQNGRRSIINTIFTSNENGEAFFNAKEVFKEGTQSFEIGLHNTLCYKRKPIYNHRYLLRNYEYGYLCEVKFAKKADDASIEKVTLKPKEYLLDNNEKIILKFYAGGDIVELEAFYDVTKIQEDEIKWGYTLLTASSKEHSKNLDTLNKNQLTNDKKDSSLFDDKISTTCCHIEKRGDIAILSGTPIDMMQDNPQAYRGKTIQIALPKTTNQQAILIFAYKNTPNYRASQLIRLNDYPQITIDCTLAETLRAYTRQDNIATLGFGVSYVCQRLWHDNPSDAKELSELIYIDSHLLDFIESIPNATMQSIVKEVLPRITLQEFSRDSNNKCPAITSQMQEIKDKNLRFYVELDWDRFYMQFPLMKNLEKEILSIYLAPTTYGYQGIPNPILPTYNGKILTKGFLAQIHKLMENKKEILKNTQKTESMQVTANLLEIAKNPKEANIPNANNKIFSITNDSTKLQECEKLLSDIKPSDLGRYQMQYYEFSDIAFGKEYMLNALNEKSNQAIALYALSGKFQIYYALDSFEVERINEKEIAIYSTQIKAYIDDSFDFRDNPNQTVGVWNYENIEFDSATSAAMALKYWWNKEANKKEQIQLALKYQQNRANNLNRGAMYYHLYNLDYQQTQKYFNLGLDFLVTSPTFKNIKIPNNLDTRKLFGIIVKA
ncbi:DUF6402 family protein [Helicobacter pullorum]|uniref:DUF6402 family protein n=1 Tax=Helicobacter pullorum TaxID=35818 RepID=UPI00098267F5|nr:DUF6402 family protein [Helicobacter pullorum]